MIDIVMGLEPLRMYPAIFIGLVLVGGFVLLPAMYLTLVGTVNLFYLFIATVLAGLLSDSFWYAIGLRSEKDKLYSWKFIKRRIAEARKFSDYYQTHGVRLVFFTKFIYGTRIASHVLAGMHKISFVKFLGATATGTALWFWIFYSLMKLLDFGIASAKATAFRIQIVFLVMAGLLLLFNWYSGKYLRRSFLNSRKKELVRPKKP